MKLLDKTAIVTGAGRGIGRAIAVTLAREGANIVAVDVERVQSASSQYQDNMLKGYQAALKLAGEIRSMGYRATAVNADITKSAEVEHMVEATLKEFGSVDILVNNAGVITYANVVDLSETEWDSVMNVNAKGVFLCCKAVAPHMIRNRSGKIVNISSESGKTGERGLAHYCASKFAVIGFTQSLALELAPYNINVNAVCPGMVYTKMWEYLTKTQDTKTSSEDAFKQAVRDLMPLTRPQTPEDIASAVLFLCLSDNITGESINVTGGHEMH
ncbi:MAG: SDR family NAD(P)-dependent oxidoreductase [Candidatus Bathyarchaeia archaeon]